MDIKVLSHINCGSLNQMINVESFLFKLNIMSLNSNIKQGSLRGRLTILE